MLRRISFFLLTLAVVNAVGQTPKAARPKTAPAPAVPAAPAAKATPQPTGDFPVLSIAVEGNRILTAEGIVAASGLRKGQKGEPKVFDAARDRLLATGYFETVACRYKPAEQGSGYDVSFEVQEMQPLYTVQIEALPVTAAEVVTWLKDKDPLFTGKVPGTEQVLARTSKEIEQLLESKGKPGTVSGKIVLVAERKYEARFMPGAGLPNVALVSFEGNKVIRNTELQNAIAAVAFGQPYTESNFRLLLENQLKPLYEKSGYMKVTFPAISAAPSTTVKGVDVHVKIDEGTQYSLGTVTVRGAMEEQSKHILRVAKLPQMKIVDFDQLRSAAIRVKDSLRHEGYLDAEVLVDRDINDVNKTVDAWFAPTPGPQYMMGQLEVKGLGLDAVAAVKKAWTVKTGEPYAAEYPDYFLKQVKEQGWFDNLGQTRAEPDIHADKHVVDVTLYFGYEPSLYRKKKPEPGMAPGQTQGPPDGIPGQPGGPE